MTRPAHRNQGPTREERAFFEELVALRQWYTSRGTEDGIAVVTVHHVIAEANAQMRREGPGPRVTRLGIDAN